jgi:DNA end-binding protein Ku
MARSLWSGSLSFGLVNVPVALFSAVRDRDVHFHQIHEPDCSPIQTRRVCAAEDREVPWEEIAKGYEVEPGRWVLLGDAELQALAPEKTRTIDIDRFVELEQIDPVYFDHPYHLVPTGGEGSSRAYALLAEVMVKTGKVALGRFVLRAKEQLVVIQVRDGALALTTMRFAEEVRSGAEIAATIDASKPSRQQIDRAVAIIEELGVAFEPSEYRDEHRAHLKKLIQAKQRGKDIPTPPKAHEPATATPDLMAALERSLADIRAREEKPEKPKRKPAKASGRV